MKSAGTRCSALLVPLLVALGCTDQKRDGSAPAPSVREGADIPVPARTVDPGKPARRESSFKETGLKIAIHDPGRAVPARAAKDAISAFRQLELKASPHLPDSEVARVNREGAEKDVEVSPEILTLVERSLYWTQRTKGAYDLTMFPVSQLWQQARRSGGKPPSEAIRATLPLVGYSEVRLARTTSSVRLLRKGLQIDPGRAALGHALDMCSRTLRSAGVRCAEMRAGDAFCVFGRGPQGEKAEAVIEHPKRPGKPLASFPVMNSAVVILRPGLNGFAAGAEHLPPVLDPRTGHPVQNVLSVTVKANSALDAQVLAHALCVLGPDGSRTLIEKLPSTEALILSLDPANPGGIRTTITRGLQSIMEWKIKSKPGKRK